LKLESLLQYTNELLDVANHPDYSGALNGLQVGGPTEVRKIAAAVDTSEASIAAAAECGADLLIVHHGLFWGGLQPLTGRHLRRVRGLIDNGVALYSCHLPLDGHSEFGNCALLARAMGLELEGRFGEYKGAPIGWYGRLPEVTDIAGLSGLVESAVGGSVHVIPGGPEHIDRVGVVTGGGASFVQDAVDLELHALVTGEGSHHTHLDAMELGIHVLFGGHYATEVFGVRALAEHLADRFDLTWEFLDQPTGL
jgi:dinuclear metal center YbgI/SA1388 family protein